jgi:hypothetical protein
MRPKHAQNIDEVEFVVSMLIAEYKVALTLVLMMFGQDEYKLNMLVNEKGLNLSFEVDVKDATIIVMTSSMLVMAGCFLERMNIVNNIGKPDPVGVVFDVLREL